MVRTVDARCVGVVDSEVDGVDGVFDMTLPESSGRARERDLVAVLGEWCGRECSDGRRVAGGRCRYGSRVPTRAPGTAGRPVTTAADFCAVFRVTPNVFMAASPRVQRPVAVPPASTGQPSRLCPLPVTEQDSIPAGIAQPVTAPTTTSETEASLHPEPMTL